jgi:ribosomal protein S18 acetylase RimI-like enzyme
MNQRLYENPDLDTAEVTGVKTAMPISTDPIIRPRSPWRYWLTMEVEYPTTDDIDTLVDQWLALAVEQRTHGSHILAEDNREAIHEKLAHSIVTGRAKVAREANEVLGFVTYELETGTYEQTVTRGTIGNLFVRQSDRNAGVGTALLEAAERDLEDAGADVVGLEAIAGNEAGRRFYRRHGYNVHRVTFEKPLSDENDNLSKDDG